MLERGRSCIGLVQDSVLLEEESLLWGCAMVDGWIELRMGRFL